VLFKAPSGKSPQTSCWISIGWYQPIASWKATEAQHWTWPANLSMTPRVSRETKMSRVWQRVS